MQTHFDLSNMGFVNCEWALKGQLRCSTQTKVYADGQTYDDKLYTLEELNYKKEFNYLNIFVKRVEHSINSSVNDDQKQPSSQSSISSISESQKARIEDGKAKLAKKRAQEEQKGGGSGVDNRLLSNSKDLMGGGASANKANKKQPIVL